MCSPDDMVDKPQCYFQGQGALLGGWVYAGQVRADPEKGCVFVCTLGVGWGCPNRGCQRPKQHSDPGLKLSCYSTDCFQASRRDMQTRPACGPWWRRTFPGGPGRAGSARRRSFADWPLGPVFSISPQALRSQGPPVAGYLPGKLL